MNIYVYFHYTLYSDLYTPIDSLPETLPDSRVWSVGWEDGIAPTKYDYDIQGNGCNVSWQGIWSYIVPIIGTRYAVELYTGYKANTDGTITIITDMQTDDEAIELYDEYPAIIDPIIYIFFSNFTGEEVYNHLINYGSSSGFSSTILTKKEYITTL